MQADISRIAKVEQPQEADVAKLLLERYYPGLKLNFVLHGQGHWCVYASGPNGGFRMTAPSPLRGGSLTALCRQACHSNVEACHA